LPNDDGGYPPILSMATVTLYTKPDCSLCDEAHAAIERIRGERSLALRVVDISNDPALSSEYGERVPVVLVDGEPAFELWVDEDELRRRIAGAAETLS
jgi:glutaredoxin